MRPRYDLSLFVSLFVVSLFSLLYNMLNYLVCLFACILGCFSIPTSAFGLKTWIFSLGAETASPVQWIWWWQHGWYRRSKASGASKWVVGEVAFFLRKSEGPIGTSRKQHPICFVFLKCSTGQKSWPIWNVREEIWSTHGVNGVWLVSSYSWMNRGMWHHILHQLQGAAK